MPPGRSEECDRLLVSEKVLEYLSTVRDLLLSLSVDKCFVLKDGYNFSDLGSNYPHRRDFRTVDPIFRLVCKTWDSRLRPLILPVYDLYFEAHITMVQSLERCIFELDNRVLKDFDFKFPSKFLSVAFKNSLLLAELGRVGVAEERLTAMLRLGALEVSVDDAARIVDSVHLSKEFKTRFILRQFDVEKNSGTWMFIPNRVPYEMLKEVRRIGGKRNARLWSYIEQSPEFVDDFDFRLECLVDPDSYTTLIGFQYQGVAKRCIQPRKGREHIATEAMKRAPNFEIFSFIFNSLQQRGDNVDASAIDWESIAEAQPSYPYWMGMLKTHFDKRDCVLRPEYTTAAFARSTTLEKEFLLTYLEAFVCVRWTKTNPAPFDAFDFYDITHRIAEKLMHSESPTREAALKLVDDEIDNALCTRQS